MLESFYRFVISKRNRAYDTELLRSYHGALPVICVGNILVGGTGKTPTVLYLVSKLVEKKFSPVILSRGYGGKEKGPIQVSKEDKAERVGDEPLLLSLRSGCPVVVSRKRALGAQFIETKKLGDVIVLDDGLQHRALSRDLNILCVDVSSEARIESFLSDKLLPFGRMREPIEEGLSRTDLILFHHRGPRRADFQPSELHEEMSFAEIPYFEAWMENIRVVKPEDGEEIAPQPVSVFCGIERPQGFYRAVEEAGYKIHLRASFRDHHPFREQELQEIVESSGDTPVVTTLKDFVRVPEAYRSQIYVLEGEIALSDEERFFEAVTEAVANHRT